MASVSTYLNFTDQTEEAFNFYKSVFGHEFDGDGISRMGDVPPQEGQPPMSEEDKNLVMHVSLETIAGHRIMGTDAPESMGFSLVKGNNIYINLQPDTKEEADRLFAALAEGGKVEQEMADMFWGDYFGQVTDKFGIHWMFNVGENVDY